MKLLILIVLLPALSGCIAFPTFDRFEFREEKLSFVEPGVTRRSELEAELVHDRVLVSERRSGRLVVYADYRSMVGVIAENAYDSYGSRDYLVVEYDEEQRVVWFEALQGSGSCTSTDICVRKGVTDYGPQPLELLVYAAQSEDALAKTFTAPAGSCNVYAWSAPGSFCPARGGMRLSFGGEDSEPWTGFAPQGYLHWPVEAAEARMEATHHEVLLFNDSLSTQTIDCAHGGNVFIELSVQCRMPGLAKGFHVRRVPEDEGRQAVMERQLILN